MFTLFRISFHLIYSISTYLRIKVQQCFPSCPLCCAKNVRNYFQSASIIFYLFFDFTPRVIFIFQNNKLQVPESGLSASSQHHLRTNQKRSQDFLSSAADPPEIFEMAQPVRYIPFIVYCPRFVSKTKNFDLWILWFRIYF